MRPLQFHEAWLPQSPALGSSDLLPKHIGNLETASVAKSIQRHARSRIGYQKTIQASPFPMLTTVAGISIVFSIGILIAHALDAFRSAPEPANN